jgi:hypothetical protein
MKEIFFEEDEETGEEDLDSGEDYEEGESF